MTLQEWKCFHRVHRCSERSNIFIVIIFITRHNYLLPFVLIVLKITNKKYSMCFKSINTISRRKTEISEKFVNLLFPIEEQRQKKITLLTTRVPHAIMFPFFSLCLFPIPQTQPKPQHRAGIFVAARK